MSQPDPAAHRTSATGWPGASPPAPPPAPTAPAPVRPGIATAAAVLGLVEAGLALLVLLVQLAGGIVVRAGMTPWAFLWTTAISAVCAGLLVGGVRLLRGVGWRLLVGTTTVEVAVVVTTMVLGVVSTGGRPDAGGTVALLVVLALPVVRLGLLLPRSVATWVERADPPTNRWVGPLVLVPVAAALVLLAVLSV